MLKRKLWLDDIRHPPDSSWWWAKTFEEAVEVLTTMDIIEISLDHDLGHDKSGYDVACWIEQQAYNGTLRPLTWYIHSSNPSGRTRIELALNQANKFWKKQNIQAL